VSHMVVLPIVLPAVCAVALLLVGESRLALQRALSLGSCLALLALGVAAAARASDGDVLDYHLGGWPAPFGIVLVLDRLAAVMLTLAAVVALFTVLAALTGERWDARGRHFHTFFQLQLAGLNGAFLTGDLFNLFVFFEVLLLASYCLLLHGRGAERLRWGVHYVTVNLATSGLFLIGIGVLYGLTGTLNLADLASTLPQVVPADQALARFAALLLLVVFGVKAALLPLNLWLPGTYGAAAPPVAALFAIMTKVGIYAMLRVHGSVFGGDMVEAAVAPWLLAGALTTALVGSLGACAAPTLAGMAAYLTIASVGTILIAVSMFSPEAHAAAVYYLVHSTLAIAALFLLAGSISAERGAYRDRLEPGSALLRPVATGLVLLVAAVSVVGMPPLSGFVGKIMILEAVASGTTPALAWSVILLSSFITLVSFVRAGSILVWAPVGPPTARGSRPRALAPVIALLAGGLALAVGAAPAQRYVAAAAAQLTEAGAYASEILRDAEPPTTRPFFRERP
jgi:multicomponent K+:H+ antiporter subunit D